MLPQCRISCSVLFRSGGPGAPAASPKELSMDVAGKIFNICCTSCVQQQLLAVLFASLRCMSQLLDGSLHCTILCCLRAGHAVLWHGIGNVLRSEKITAHAHAQLTGCVVFIDQGVACTLVTVALGHQPHLPAWWVQDWMGDQNRHACLCQRAALFYGG